MTHRSESPDSVTQVQEQPSTADVPDSRTRRGRLSAMLSKSLRYVVATVSAMADSDEVRLYRDTQAQITALTQRVERLELQQSETQIPGSS